MSIYDFLCLDKSHGDKKLSDSYRSQNSESSSKRKRSIIGHIYDEDIKSTKLEEFLGVNDLNVVEPSEDFKQLISRLANESESMSEDQTSRIFASMLTKINPRITFTGNKQDGDFELSFHRNRPDFTWSISENFYPWNIVSIIEKKKDDLKVDYISQMLEYLRLILRYSPKRKYAIGCLTNYKAICFGKASLINDKFHYTTFYSKNVIDEYWKFLHCKPIDLGHVVDLKIPDVFKIISGLGK